mgnify:FL=1
MVEVSTSILSVEKEGCIQKFYDIECAGTNYFHIDVMDGKFVKNNTVKIMEEYTNYIKQISNTKIDVHLMVEDVDKFVKEYADMEVDSITFHIESVKDQKEVLNIIKYIKDKNIRVGLSIKPETENEEIYEYLPYIHKVLVMSVEPGEGGQKFKEETIEKVRNLSNYIEKNRYDVDIEVDGGINSENAYKLKEMGANILVAGTYIINSQNMKEAIKSLKK